jgi:hypothetical protein
MLLANAGPKRSDVGGVGCDAADGADHEKTLDWMTGTGHGLPLVSAAAAFGNWLAMQRQKAPVRLTGRQYLESVSRYISLESEIPRGSIEAQESEKVARDY